MCGIARWRGAILSLALVCVVSRVGFGGEPSSGAAIAQLRWNLNDRWVLETRGRSIQPRNRSTELGPAVRWLFTVAAVERVGDHECLRLDIVPVGRARRPLSQVWVDRTAWVIRQLRTELPFAGGFRAVTERYEFPGKAAPVLSPFPAIPLDLPVFAGAGTDAEVFRYSTISGAARAKGADGVGFSLAVRQQTTAMRPKESKPWVDERLAKGTGVESGAGVMVELVVAHRRVRQVWTNGLPWPVFSDNGSTEARLVEVLPAARTAD